MRNDYRRIVGPLELGYPVATIRSVDVEPAVRFVEDRQLRLSIAIWNLVFLLLRETSLTVRLVSLLPI
ncbi:MAG: hypothetical protein ACLUEV_08120 [Alistipes sp.]